ncbi:MAG: hypothetical protein LBJ18_02635, partial [Rickettsiales bacterium]|nr:hypothetical protein [Rickettsiales bacterium]
VDGFQNDYTISPIIKTATNNIFGDATDIANLTEATNQESEKIDPIKLAQFKNSRNQFGYAQLLRDMYDPSKEGSKSAFNSQFANHEGSEITKPMDLVVKNFDYSKLDGKFTDQRNFWESVQKNIEDWSEDHILKLWKRNLRHNYIEPNAKGVVDAICKLEISPEKGLKEILAKKADIKKIILQKSPASEKGFDFLCEVLEKINASGDMKKAFAGALKNGKKAEAVAKEIIKAAMAHQPPKVAEAKVALETLAVMRYDIFSAERGKDMSKAIMGANFFDGASFMKNDGVKFIINAAQKTFNLGLNGAFWAGVMGRNLIQHARGKISPEDIDALTKSMDKIKDNADRFGTFESATAEQQQAKARYDDFETQHQALFAAAGVNSADDYMGSIEVLEEEKTDLQDELARDQNYKNFITEAQAFIANPNAHAGFTDEFESEFAVYYNTLPAMSRLNADYTTLMPGFLRYCQQKVQAHGLSQAQIQLKQARIGVLNQDIANRQVQINNIRPDYIKLKSELNVANDILKFQTKKRNERAEERLPHDPKEAPMNDDENTRVLAHFWNACNGYDFGLNVNDYNFLKAHKMQSQKLQFNAAVKDRL